MFASLIKALHNQLCNLTVQKGKTRFIYDGPEEPQIISKYNAWN